MDDLVLNLADDDSSRGRATPKKGGRWTDRAKAKKVAKRKSKSTETKTNLSPDELTYETTGDPRPTKRPRKDASRAVEISTAQSSRPTTQIISSLFTHNPKVEAVATSSASRSLKRPSNAPLDASSFSGLGLDPLIIAHLSSKLNIDKPTSIQRAALPALLAPPKSEEIARDVFIQSQTGSGKTLSFLLPIIQDLLPLSSLSWIDRSVGTLAVIIVPTRELAKQISDVLEALLKLRLRPQDESAEDDAPSARLTRWLVSGLLTGGATRAHEKARLRKGVPILVSTPGRLLDHLQNTASLNIGKCRWLVLDEADRLMELGFEETITGILKGLEGRRKLAVQAVKEGVSTEAGGWDWERKRRTVLCSATIREDVQKLAGMALNHPIVVKATEREEPLQLLAPASGGGDDVASAAATTKFTPPSQLAQKYVVVPLKLRLVTLVALLRSLLAQAQVRKGSKIIVFFSCTDSVDFHWRLLGGSTMDQAVDEASDVEGDSDEEAHRKSADAGTGDDHFVQSGVLPGASIFRLHGSLPLATRMASVKGFSTVSSSKSTAALPPSILLCTSVASRGLDLPLVRAVVQYDLPTEGGATEYVHRVGRTARAGKGGEAWSVVAPSEAEWVRWVEDRMAGGRVEGEKPTEKEKVQLQAIGLDEVLRGGFGGKGTEFEERATEVQLSFERWALRDKEAAELARKAYLSHMRAYATHPSDEKHIFHIRHLHLGHLAKAFALRESPNAVNTKNSQVSGGKSKSKGRVSKPSAVLSKAATAKAVTDGKKTKRERDWDEAHDGEAEKRMKEAVRSQGRLIKKGGKMVSSGTAEFQLASGAALEKLVNGQK